VSKKGVIGLSILAGLLVVGAVGFGLSSLSQPNTNAQSLPDFSRAAALTDSVQVSDGGGVQVQVTFDPQSVGQGEGVSFEVTMNTHTVELGVYDLGELSRVVDQGTELGETSWTPIGTGTGHHVQGRLTAADPTGRLRIAERITLEITGLPGPDVRQFQWQVRP